VPVHGGRIEVGVRGSRAASELSKRAIAQREFLATGDDTKLRKLGKTKILDASGREVPFLTDEEELARQGDLGALSFESLYARRG
jgi:predicted amidohydrolase YtcJ